ncbi:hypothetical protein [Arenimonas sp.]|uniref:hypothetical protein n=1 Tax=Arenimonas sp. TaxID=1872635 RepID=UPI0035AFEFEA
MKIIIVLMLAAGLAACGTYGSRGGYYGSSKSGAGAGGDTVLVCHKGKKTMELPRAALDGHLGHGDRRGRC